MLRPMALCRLQRQRPWLRVGCALAPRVLHREGEGAPAKIQVARPFVFKLRAPFLPNSMRALAVLCAVLALAALHAEAKPRVYAVLMSCSG